MESLNQSQLKELLRYDELTGQFIWLKQQNSRALVGSIAGSICKNGYVVIGINNIGYSAHRLAFLYMIGEIPEAIDHINGQKSCNIWSNLRMATSSQNRLNSKVMSNNELRVKGVCWVESRKRFKACVTDSAKNRIRKYFKQLTEATKWLEDMRQKHHGEFACNG